MGNPTVYRLLADGLLLVHALFVLFVVGGLILFLFGGWRRWKWVRNRTLRVLHLLAIAFVIVQAWLGRICPLTAWEMALRHKAGAATYDGAFIAHWIERLLYYNAPMWVFALAYTLFGALVLASWWWVPPRRRGATRAGDDEPA